MPRKISEKVQELHCQFEKYGHSAREWMRKCVLMLPELERERVWEKKGFGSLAEYAGKLSGMSHKTVIDGLRILQAVEHMPDIMKVIAVRGINSVKPIVTLLTRENQKFWAEKVKVMSQHTLQMYLHEMILQNDILLAPPAPLEIQNSVPSLDIFGEGALSENQDLSQQKAIHISDIGGQHYRINEDQYASPSAQKKVIAIDLRVSTLARLEKLKGDSEWDTLMNELMDMRETVLMQEQQRIQEEHPAATEAASRHIPVEIMQHIEKRSRGRCEYPKCGKRYEIIHHIQRFTLEEVHDPEKMVALCTQHERLAHLGLIDREESSVHEWSIQAEANLAEPKYAIDQIVQRYRRPGRIRPH